jgi:hypothetical protein
MDKTPIESSAFIRSDHVLFRLLRVVIGLVLAGFLFLQGMSCAEKFHRLGYALMEQALVFSIAGVVSMMVKSIPKESWIGVAILNSLILLRRCSGKDILDLDELRADVHNSPLLWLQVASVYFMIILGINAFLFIRPFDKKRLLIVASTLIVLLVTNFVVLVAKL